MIAIHLPSSPPKNKPPAEAKKYVAKSPNVVGFNRGVISGNASKSHQNRTHLIHSEDIHTGPPVRKNNLRRLLLRAEGLEERMSRTSQSEGSVQSQANSDRRAKRRPKGHPRGGGLQGVAVIGLEILLDVFVGESREVVGSTASNGSKGFRHGDEGKNRDVGCAIA